MTFFDERFPENISENSQFISGWRTTVTESFNAAEQRNQDWSLHRCRYDVAYGVKTVDDLLTLKDFHTMCRGRLHTFRFKDWLDYQATEQTLSHAGARTVQLVKLYGTSQNTYTRSITKPVDGTVTMTRDGADFTDFTLDAATGIITFDHDSYVGIGTVAQDANGTLTTDTPHGLSTNDVVFLTDITSMTELNDRVFTITVTGASTFELNQDTTGYTAFSGSAGGVYVYPQPSEVMQWSGQFDVPCRFNSDELAATLLEVAHGATSIEVIEVRE